jgi:hypothetical protein
MTRPTRRELEEMRRDGLSAAVRERFHAAESRTAAWASEQRPQRGLADALDWIDELRRLFGDPEPDRTPWRGAEYRL